MLKGLLFTASIAAAIAITLGSIRSEPPVVAATEPEAVLRKGDRLELAPQARIDRPEVWPIVQPEVKTERAVRASFRPAKINKPHRQGCSKRWYRRHGHRYWRCRR